MKPMKASPLDLNKIHLHLPTEEDIARAEEEKDNPNSEFVLKRVYGSPKYDGIRGIIDKGQVLSNSLKVFPNKFIQAWAKENEEVLQGFDGELIVGEPNDPNVFNNTTGPIRAINSQPDFRFYVFDRWGDNDNNFLNRNENLIYSMMGLDKLPPRVIIVHHVPLTTLEEIYAYEEEQLALGYEGIMLRNITTPYKFGRSYPTGGELVKVKRFVDTEAEVIGFQELCSNQNEATVNEMGNTARSSHKENKVPMDTLGALMIRGFFDDGTEYTVNIGTGFTAEQRQEIWDNRLPTTDKDGNTIRSKYLGEFAKFKYQDVGTQEAPRTPVFLGWRMKEDM